MAKIRFISVLKEGSGRMEDVVFCRWKDRLYMKPYKKQRATNSEAQVAVRNSFTAMARNWKCLGGIVRASWEMHVKELSMTGYNAFLGANIRMHREGKLIELCKDMGMEPPAGFTAVTGTASGTIETRFTPVTGGRYVTFFVQKKEDAATGGTLVAVSGGMDLQSPFIITGLEAGKEYHVYAVVTNNAYGEATAVSASVSAIATTGA